MGGMPSNIPAKPVSREYLRLQPQLCNTEMLDICIFQMIAQNGPRSKAKPEKGLAICLPVLLANRLSVCRACQRPFELRHVLRPRRIRPFQSTKDDAGEDTHLSPAKYSVSRSSHTYTLSARRGAARCRRTLPGLPFSRKRDGKHSSYLASAELCDPATGMFTAITGCGRLERGGGETFPNNAGLGSNRIFSCQTARPG